MENFDPYVPASYPWHWNIEKQETKLKIKIGKTYERMGGGYAKCIASDGYGHFIIEHNVSKELFKVIADGTAYQASNTLVNELKRYHTYYRAKAYYIPSENVHGYDTKWFASKHKALCNFTAADIIVTEWEEKLFDDIEE